MVGRKLCFFLRRILEFSELVLAISARPCGPAHSASHHGAPRVISPLPGPGGPGSLDAGRRDLVGHGRLEEGGMRGT